MKTDTRTIGDITVAVIVPRFDAYTASEEEAVLRDRISMGAKKIIIDFSQTEYVASAGLRVLLSAAKNLKNIGGKIALFAMKPQIYEVFEMTGFTQIFKIYSSQEEALESMKVNSE